MTTKEKAEMFLKLRDRKSFETKSPKEVVVAKKEKRECESCGQLKELTSNYGKLVCPTCSTMRGCARLRPKSVIDSFREFNNISEYLTEEDIKKAMPVVPKTATPGLEDEIKKLKKEIDEHERVILDQEHQLEQFFKTPPTQAIEVKESGVDKEKLLILLVDIAEASISNKPFKISHEYFQELRKAATA